MPHTYGEVKMEIEGVVQNGVIVPDDADALPEGTRVRIRETLRDDVKSFGHRYAKYKNVIQDMPDDLAAQHDHYRLGTPKK
jgi:hypothetical protein